MKGSGGEEDLRSNCKGDGGIFIQECQWGGIVEDKQTVLLILK
jgi:hypothetical protein